MQPQRFFRIAATAFVVLTAHSPAAEVVPLEVNQVEPVRLETTGGVCSADFGKAAYGNLQITLKKIQPTSTRGARAVRRQGVGLRKLRFDAQCCVGFVQTHDEGDDRVR